MKNEALRSVYPQRADGEAKVPLPRVPDQGEGSSAVIDNDKEAKIRALIAKVDIILSSLYNRLKDFDKVNEVAEYNQKTLVGDNPIVYRLRQPLVDEISKYEEYNRILRAQLLGG